jgi:predicted ATP-dependent endonuclease of OLD family
MHYVSFMVSKYRAINNLEIKLDSKLIPLVGINECGKTTILQAIYSFDYLNRRYRE